VIHARDDDQKSRSDPPADSNFHRDDSDEFGIVCGIDFDVLGAPWWCFRYDRVGVFLAPAKGLTGRRMSEGAGPY
jgi:hypothetical protein